MSSRKIPPNEEKKARLQKFMEACNEAEKRYRNSSLSSIMDQQFHLMRSQLLRIARHLLGDHKYGQRVLESLWKSAFYGMIVCMRGVSLNEHQKAWYDMQLSIFAGELARIGTQFPELQCTVYIYLGDLRRYAWLLFSRERDKALATLHYRNVIALDGGGGLVFNQLGLLLQDKEPIKALLYFLMASSCTWRPFPGAFANIIGMLAKRSSVLDDSVVSVIEHTLTAFSRVEFQELKAAVLEQIETQLDAKNALSVSMSINLLAAAVLVLSSKGKQTELRSLIEIVLSGSEKIMKATDEWTPTKVAAVRRRHASGDARENGDGDTTKESVEEVDDVASVEDEDDGDDIIELESDDEFDFNVQANSTPAHEPERNSDELKLQMLQVSLLYFAVTAAPQIYADRTTPLALRHQFERFCQTLCHTLNAANCVLDSSSNIPLWHLAFSTSALLLPRFLEDFATSDDTPVEYNGFFRFVAKSTREENLMKNMAKMRLIHETKKVEAQACIPVYVVPEEEVLIQRPWVLKGIVKKGSIIVVIAEDTLRRLDKVKKMKAGAREAIRFIESHLSSSNGCLRIQSSCSPNECAEKLVAESKVDNALIVAILTLAKDKEEVTPKSAIMTVNAEKFYSSLQ